MSDTDNIVETCSLSSGSNGNCFYIRTGKYFFLVDFGINYKQILSRLEKINTNISDCRGIFITHEHSDHTAGLKVLLSKYNIPIYITEKTCKKLKFYIREPNKYVIHPNEKIQIFDTIIQILSKKHDAIDPTLFCFFYKNIKISFITDVGRICSNIIDAVKNSHIIFLETNYDYMMLQQSGYNEYLKHRISGGNGHLSNNEAGYIILKYSTVNLKHVFLSHISTNTNTPEFAYNTFTSIISERTDLNHVKTHLTSRTNISSLIRIKLKNEEQNKL